MPDRTPLFTFPGVGQIVSLSATLGHGITPSVFTLVIAPQDDFEGAAGDLVLFDGVARIALRDCKVDRHTFEYNDAGQIWRLSLLDRRWKWRWGAISGFYNARNDDNTVKQTPTGNEQTPQQLATLLLQAMGEVNFDVGQLPNDARPTIEWDGDLPAEMLAQLCDQLGCRVILRLDNTVSLQPVGVGQPLPEDDLVIDDGLTIDPPEQPDQIAVLCGRDRFQADFLLEAVGLNGDNTIVPIGSLSYMPAVGWGGIDLPTFKQVAENFRERAKASVFRWYRIKMPFGIPDYGQITALEQILPIEDEQVDTVTLSQVTSNKPAQVYGSFFTGNDGYRNNVLQSSIDPNGFDGTTQEYKKSFTIDRDAGIVKFADCVFLNQSDGGGSAPGSLSIGAAVLRLRIAVSVKDPATRAPLRYFRLRSYGNRFGTPTQYLQHHEIVQTHVPKYDTSFNVQSVTTNQADVNNRCDYYLDAAEQHYKTTFPQTISYAGLRDDIEMDGAIQQITFEISAAGCRTTVSRNDELLHRAPSYQERRALEKTRQLKQLAEQLKPSVMRQNLKAIARQ